ncbi:MAG: Na/Pi cotransporter family protein [Clostridia bacterium]|nr:Na/Pi cotransporter family protein [Clostridia bacterium]
MGEFNIFSIITLFGGLAFFLYGMNVMSSGLERLAGGKLEGLLKKMTSNPLKSLLLGAGITAAIQSSSAVTVMLVGLVNSGIMGIGQTIGVIMGSNVGTTVTAWILSLTGIDGKNVFVQLLKPENFSLIFALIGIGMYMMAKSNKKKDIGTILLGFAVLMFGMELMSGAVEPLKDSPVFKEMMTAFSNPILGVLVGLVITAVIQSSSASVGILQAIARTGGVTYSMAIPIIMGQNIGTCVTALISSIGVSRNAKKVAVVHITFNIIGTVVFLSVYCILNAFLNFAFADQSIGVVGIALIHTIFNVAATLMLLPFTKQLEKFANFVLRDKKTSGDEAEEFLDSRLLNTPSVAIAECEVMANKMADVALDTLKMAIATVRKYKPENAEKILAFEERLDKYEDMLGTYLVKMSTRTVSDTDSKKMSRILHSIDDFERMGDHAVNILSAAQEINEKGIEFSKQAQKEIGTLADALEEILEITIKAYTENDSELAVKVEPLEQVIDDLVDVIKAGHIKRLGAGACTIEMGFVLSDLLNNYERVSDHCSNVALSIIQGDYKNFDAHQYIHDVKYNNDEFTKWYEKYTEKYSV